jgi:hypothetical protein
MMLWDIDDTSSYDDWTYGPDSAREISVDA